MTSRTKKCVYCNSNKVIKKGNRDGIQKYQCKECNKYFSNERKLKKNRNIEIWNDFVFHKQTVRELIIKYELSKNNIVNILHQYQVEEKRHLNIREVYLSVDATYFGKRKNGTSWGVLVFRDNVLKENLWWKVTKNESLNDYLKGRIYRKIRIYN